MSEPNRKLSENDNLVTSLKIGVFMTVLGWMVLAVEAPKLTAAPDVAAASATPAQTAATGTSPAAVVDYFPAQYPAPQGEPASTPAAF